MSAELRLDNIVAGYGARAVLHGVSLEVAPGASLVVVGPNGSGKSTLMRVVTGLIRPQSGRVLWDGRDITALDAPGRARLGLGYVPQEANVFRNLSVLDNLKLGHEFIASGGAKALRQRLDAVKSRADWLRDAQMAVNRYIRLRDRDKGCISCDRPATWDGQWHASHFRSVGAASAVRFNLWNIHKACSVCNHHLSGNIAGYMPRLVEKIGPQKVEWLQQQNHVVRYEVEYLKRLKSVFNRRANRVAKMIK